MSDNNNQPMRYQVHSRETLSKGFLTVEVLHLSHELFNGGYSEILTRELLQRGDAVAILLHDPRLDEVVLVEQFRVGAIDEQNPWVLDLIAGMIEAGEVVDTVARRETQEEAGLEIQGECLPIARYYGSVGGCSEKTYLLYGRVDASKAAGVHGLECEGEDIKVRRMPTTDLYQLIASDEILPAGLIIAGQWLASREQIADHTQSIP